MVHYNTIKSVYSGSAKRYELKVLSISLPNGLIDALYGSIGAHENDVVNMCSIILFVVM
jgi:hypothetical protein